MDTTKRQRPYLERACKTIYKVDPLALSPTLWRKLPVELAYKVLSFLPVDRLVDTLRRVLSHRNLEQLLQCHIFSQIFGHGKNLVSSYGFVTLSNPYSMLRLSAFEHESMQWRDFPKKGHPEVNNSELIPGGSDGLLLSTYCSDGYLKSGRIKLLYRKHHKDFVHYSDIGVWNPLLSSFKLLPEHPWHTIERSYNPTRYTIMRYTEMYIVMVDESSKTYKVFVSYKNGHDYYSVYNSITGRWSSANFLPDFLIDNRRIRSCTAACDRYVIFDGCDSRRNHVPGRHFDREDYICWFDSQIGSWDKAFLSEIVADLDSNPKSGLKSGRIKCFAILHGVLYMVILIRSNGGEVKYTLASLDLSTLGHGFAPVFRFEALVPVTYLPIVEGRYSFPFNLYTYTMQGKGYVCVRTSSSGKFLQFDVSSGSWLEHDKLPELGDRGWKDGENCFPFKASLVVP